MSAAVRHITIDCADPYELCRFWRVVLGGSVGEVDGPGDPDVLLELDGGLGLLFIRSADEKAVKNRVHLDVTPTDRTRDEEVERLLAAGASIHAGHRRPDGTGWVTMLDPEGNEFCVERSAAERAES
ncbi:MAG: VOC family protein [Actinobacteria bacterium]|nr:VOC family protein [Actinomycetota bacterium]